MIRELNKKEYAVILDLAKNIKPNFTINDFSLNSIVIVYELDSKIVGFLEYYINYETIELLNIAVDINYRNKGIGTNMISYLTKISGIDRIMLEVRESNKEALALYNKLGFSIVRTIKNYYGNEIGYAMERKIR